MVTPDSAETMTPPERSTVLCIDDDAMVLRFFRAFLESSGYRTLTTTDGLQGLAVARQDRPDVILLDVMMRGLSGFDICRKFRADPALHDIPIVLLTVLSEPAVANTGREAGADLTLTKLAHPETILTAIAQVLSERGVPPRG
jgi:putative two-component system response regulator